MRVGPAHRLALVLTAVLPVLGLLSGSTLLSGASASLLILVLIALPRLHQHPRKRARVWLVHALTLLGLAGALFVFPRAKIDAGLCIVMLGLANRLLLRAGQRDDLIIVGSAGVLLSAATIVTPGFSFALLILLFVPAALWAMLTASILGLAERASGPEARRAAFARLAARPIPRLKGAVTGWGLALMVVGYVAVSFLPRYRFGHLLSPGGLVAFDGPGRGMRLDAGGVQTAGGGAVALRIQPGRDMGSADLEGLYARVYALDEIEGASFTDGQGPVERLELGRPDRDERLVEVSMRRVAGRQEPHPVAVIGRSGPTQVYLRRPERYASGTWITRVPQASLQIRYRASLVARAGAQLPDDPEAKRAYEARFLGLPDELDPRIPVLALRLARGAGDRRDIVQRVLAHFDSGFRYTLSPLEGEAEDPLSRFLFEARAGHCELYAGALAVLLRAAGVPARVAAGYYGGWFNHRSRELELGGEDAHAWVEALVDDRWIWVDATPADARARRRHKTLAWLRDLWDAAEALWYEHVIDFDEARRRRLVGDIEAAFVSSRSGGDWFEDGMGEARLAGGRGRTVVLGAGGLLAVVLVLLARRARSPGALGRRLRRVLDPEGARPSAPLGILAREAPSATAARAVERYERLRFGPGAGRSELRAARAAVSALEAEAKRGRRLSPRGRARGSGGRSPAR